MALTHLLFLCPRCGHDPLEGLKDEARCPGCGLEFARGGEGGLIRVMDDGKEWKIQGSILTKAMLERFQGALDLAFSSGEPIRSAVVTVRRSGAETPVHWKGQLLGFAEAMGEPTPGTLRLTPDSLGFSRDSGALTEWNLLSIRAVQTSSRALQFSPSSGGLLEFRFPDDSPFRWEHLLRATLKRLYRKNGLGEIVEFQPRIVAESGLGGG